MVMNEFVSRLYGTYIKVKYNESKITSIAELVKNNFIITPRYSEISATINHFMINIIPVALPLYDLYYYHNIVICDNLLKRLTTMITVNTIAINSNSFDLSLYVGKKISRENLLYVSFPRFMINMLTLTSLLEIENPSMFAYLNIPKICANQS